MLLNFFVGEEVCKGGRRRERTLRSTGVKKKRGWVGKEARQERKDGGKWGFKEARGRRGLEEIFQIFEITKEYPSPRSSLILS